MTTREPVNISSSQIPQYLPPDQLSFSVLTMGGSGFREVSTEEVSVLISSGHLRAVVRGRRLHKLYLTVPPDVAGRSMGETRHKVKDSLHTDANTTVLRSMPHLPRHVKRHHLAHCFAWPH